MKKKNINYSVYKNILEYFMRGKTKPEDRIVGVVLARLKKEVGFTYHELEVETGIPTTTLQGLIGHFTALANPGRISQLAKYFQEIHKLDYVDEKYFLTGTPEDHARLEHFRQEEMATETPPFLEITQEIA